MKQALVLIPLFLFSILAFDLKSQDTFDKGLEQLSTELSTRIGNKQIKRIAVLKFVDQSESHDELAEYIAEELSVYLTNNDVGFDVYDRHYLTQLLEEHKLNMSGIIDASTAKQVGEFSGADALIVGRFTILGDKVKIWVKVLDTGTAMQIAAETATLSVDELISSLIDADPTQEIVLPDYLAPSSEANTTYGQPETKHGSICFERKISTNAYSNTLRVEITNKSTGEKVESLTLPPASNACAYDL